jgi:hypothetical protein
LNVVSQQLPERAVKSARENVKKEGVVCKDCIYLVLFPPNVLPRPLLPMPRPGPRFEGNFPEREPCGRATPGLLAEDGDEYGAIEDFVLGGRRDCGGLNNKVLLSSNPSM